MHGLPARQTQQHVFTRRTAFAASPDGESAVGIVPVSRAGDRPLLHLFHRLLHFRGFEKMDVVQKIITPRHEILTLVNYLTDVTSIDYHGRSIHQR